MREQSQRNPCEDGMQKSGIEMRKGALRTSTAIVMHGHKLVHGCPHETAGTGRGTCRVPPRSGDRRRAERRRSS